MGKEIIALIALTAMEIVLGIDNIVFISIATSRLPQEKQRSARLVGLGLAMIMRLLLLLSISWIIGMKEPLFHVGDLGLFSDWFKVHEDVDGVSIKDLIMLGGGLFLIQSSVREIHHKVEGQHDEEQSGARRTTSYWSVISQIIFLDLIFSLDSVITAVGMSQSLWTMVTAVIIAVLVMMVFAGKVSSFVEKHPTVKMLALSFLLLIGVMLLAEGVGTEINKGYIYFAMAFSLLVESLNLVMQARSKRQAAAAKKA